MKRRITKDDLVVFLRELDTRVEDKSDAWIDRVIDFGFAETSTVTSSFTIEEHIDLSEHYDLGETVFNINLKQNSVNVYDMYVMKTGQDLDMYELGEKKNRDSNVIYRDSQNTQVVKVNLTNSRANDVYDAAVVKYFYIPTSEFDDVYIDQDVYLVLQYALASSAYDMLQDVERSSQKRAGMQRAAVAIVETHPEDYGQPQRESMFPPGV